MGTCNDSGTALATERRLFPGVTTLAEGQDAGAGKSLLARATGVHASTGVRISLRPIVTETQWRAYTDQRIQVEKGFGATAADARRTGHELRGRRASIGLGRFAVEQDHDMVAAIGRFRMPAPAHHWARLQDVDVFPNWRGHGYGTAMLVAMLRLLASEGATMVVVGADEDDWPLTWYRRHGFCDVARVRKKD